MDQIQLRNRLLVATGMWKEATGEPLPKMPPGNPADQIQNFELRLVDRLFERIRRCDADPLRREVLLRLQQHVAGRVAVRERSRGDEKCQTHGCRDHPYPHARDSTASS